LRPSWYEYADGVPKVKEYVSPGSRTGDDGNAFVSDTTWCGCVSVFFHVTVSSSLITTVAGENPVAVMFTVTVAAGSECETAGAAPAIASVPASRTSNFLIVIDPLFLIGHEFCPV
jgi:hypothetical protein